MTLPERIAELGTNIIVAGVLAIGGGTVSLGGTLTQLRITRSGTSTFDAGSVVIGYR